MVADVRWYTVYTFPHSYSMDVCVSFLVIYARLAMVLANAM